MRHINCGGKVAADSSLHYIFNGLEYPAWRCTTCGKEVLTDDEVDFNGTGMKQERRWRVRYSTGRREWLAVVYREEGSVTRVLAVGCEDSEAEAQSWALGTVALMNERDSDDAFLPDKYDRRQNHGL